MTALASRGQLRASFLRWALFVVPAIVLLGFLSGKMAGSGPGNLWLDGLVKPDIYSDPAMFEMIRMILLVMIGLALALVCAAWGARGRTAAIVAFIVQFALNLAWSPIFFAMYEMTTALVVIGALNVALIVTIVLFWKVRRLAALLLLPYLAWTLFTTFLNYEILRMNPGADGVDPTRAVQRFEI